MGSPERKEEKAWIPRDCTVNTEKKKNYNTGQPENSE